MPSKLLRRLHGYAPDGQPTEPVVLAFCGPGDAELAWLALNDLDLKLTKALKVLEWDYSPRPWRTGGRIVHHIYDAKGYWIGVCAHEDYARKIVQVVNDAGA